MAPTLTAHESRFLFEVKGVSYQTAVLGFKLFEGISSPFALHVSLVSEDEINFDEMVGKEALLTLLGEDNDRYLHGILRQFIQNGSKGRFYFFEHAKDKHVLVFGDSTVAYKAIEGEVEITFNPAIGMVPGKEFVYQFAFSQKVFSGKMTRRDFNFEKPTLDLTSKEQDKSYQKLEVYDYPGR